MSITYEKYIKEMKTWTPVTKKGGVWQDPDNGEHVELFRINVFAEAMGRKVEQIKILIKKGDLPRPLFEPDGEQCKHWYSAAQIINCHRLMRYRYSGQKYLSNPEMFKQFMHDLRGVWYAKKVVINTKGEDIT